MDESNRFKKRNHVFRHTIDELICVCGWYSALSLCAAISIVLPKILMSTLPQSWHCKKVRQGYWSVILLPNVYHVTELHCLCGKHSFDVPAVSGTSIKNYFSKNNKWKSGKKLGYQIPKGSAGLISLCKCFIFICLKDEKEVGWHMHIL